MDEELAMLMDTFNTLQSEPSSVRLSEANCAEIVSKLYASKRLNILYTLDGSFVTPEQLLVEMSDEVVAAGGRLEVTQLHTLLNIDIDVIENAVDKLIGRDATLHIVGGELLTTYYIDMICDEIQQSLHEVGQLSIASLASRFRLSSSYVLDMLKKHVGISITGTLEGDVLYTQMAVARTTARVRGAMRAASYPTPVSQFNPGKSISSKLFDSVVSQLISRGDVHGSVLGDTYIPEVYSRAAQQDARSFFSNNGYISYTRLDGLGLSKHWIRAEFPGGLSIGSHYVSSNMLASVDASLEECVREGTHCDVAVLLPGSFSHSDCVALISKCDTARSAGASLTLLSDHYCLSQQFLSQVNERFSGIIESAAKQYSATHAPEPQEVPAAKETKKGGKKRRNKAQKQRPQQAVKEPTLDAEEMLRHLTGWYRDEDDQMLEELVEHLMLSLSARLLELVEQEKQSKTVLVTKENVDELLADITVHRRNLEIFLRGASSFPDPRVAVAIEKHVVREIGGLLLDNLLLIETASLSIPKPDLSAANKARKALCVQFPRESQEAFLQLVSRLNSGAAEAFLEQLDKCEELLQLRVKPVDSKMARALVFTHTRGFTDQLQAESNPPECFHLAVVSLYAKCYGEILHLPPKYLPQVVEALKEHLEAEQLSLLRKYNASVVQWITQGDTSAQMDMQPLKQLVEAVSNAKKKAKKGKK